MEAVRVELVQAKAKVNEMEYVIRKAERNLDVSLLDQKQMDKSLASSARWEDRRTSRDNQGYAAQKGRIAGGPDWNTAQIQASRKGASACSSVCFLMI